MFGLEYIGKFFFQRTVSALIIRTITEFKMDNSSEKEVDAVIEKLKKEIITELQSENKSVQTHYNIETLYHYYKLARAYEKKLLFEDMMAMSEEALIYSISQIEMRQDLLQKEDDKATIYNYLAEFYESREYQKCETYNLRALDYKDKLSDKERAFIYKRQAFSEMLHQKYKEALINIKNAINIEPFNTSFLCLEIEILIYLNRLDTIFLQIQRIIKELKEKKDILGLIDAYILLAKYHGKKQNEEDALSSLDKAYSLLKDYPDDIYGQKKIYLLSQIANISGDEDKIIDDTINEEVISKAREAVTIRTKKQFNYRTRLDFIEIGIMLNKKGVELYKQWEYPKAIKLLEKSLTITEQVLGENHPNTSTSYNNLAGLYESMGEYAKAEPLYLRALKIREEVLGENYPDTASSYNNLADLYNLMGEYEKAEPLYLRALKIREESLGENHPDTATSYNSLAELYRVMGEYKKAEPLYLKALNIKEEVLGENHPATATSYGNLALLYSAMGEYKKAEPLFLKSLKIKEEVLGENHPATATSYNNLAGSYHSMGEYEKAEPLFLKNLKIVEESLGENHPSVALSYNNLAGLYYSMGEYEKAEPLYLKSQKIREESLGENHPDTATSYGNLASLYESMGEYEKAEPLYLKSQKIREELLGENHPDTATSYNNLGLFYYNTGEYQKAYAFMKRALEIRERVLPPNHPYTIGSRNWLKEIEKKLNN